jgi:FkbM family methyltransferase
MNEVAGPSPILDAGASPADGVFLPNKFTAKYLASFHFRAQTLVDVGVERGTPELYRLFKGREIVLIDPISDEKELAHRLEGMCEYKFFKTAVGAAPGKAFFNVMAGRGQSGFMARTELARGEIVERQEVEVTTLDSLLGAHSFARPFGLKIDTEGYELEVLKGAEKVLAETEFVIAEVSVKKRFVDSYRFSDIVSFLGRHGFELIDILNFRPKTQRFFDCLFVKYDHPKFG